MSIAVLIPYRAPRRSWRARLAAHTARLWSQIPGVEVVHASDKPADRSAPFNLAKAVNRARQQTRASRLLVIGSDHIPPTVDVFDRIRDTLDRAPWMAVFAETHGYSRATTSRILTGRVDPYTTVPDGTRVRASWGVTAVRADVFDDLGGYDEAFAGWGDEDRAWRLALTVLYPGGVEQGVGVVRTLWHPRAVPAPRNRGRYAQYVRAAAEGPAGLQRLLHLTPRPVSAPPATRTATAPAPVVVREAPRIVATYARCGEPQSLVDGLRENLSWCDDLIELAVERGGSWTHEGRRLAAQRDLIRARHGDGVWTLWLDPDERLEDGAADRIRDLVGSATPGMVFGFVLREMWTPTGYRVDGQWAVKKPRWRLFHLHAGQTFTDRPIHCGPIPRGGRRTATDVNLYHLKMIEPGNRVARAQAYRDADPSGRWQPKAGDWSHLTDESGLQVEEIPTGRGFTPPYVAGSYQFIPPGRPVTAEEG